MAGSPFAFLKDEKIIIVFVLLLTVAVFLIQVKNPVVPVEKVSTYQDVNVNTEILNKPFFDSETAYENVVVPPDLQAGRDNPFTPAPTSTKAKAANTPTKTKP